MADLDRLRPIVDRRSPIDPADSAGNVRRRRGDPRIAAASHPEPLSEPVGVGAARPVFVGVQGSPGGEPLPERRERRLVRDPPDEPAQGRARLEGRGKRGVVGRPKLHLAAVKGLEADAAIAIAGRCEAPVGEEPGALLHVLDAVHDLVDSGNHAVPSPSNAPGPGPARSASRPPGSRAYPRVPEAPSSIQLRQVFGKAPPDCVQPTSARFAGQVARAPERARRASSARGAASPVFRSRRETMCDMISAGPRRSANGTSTPLTLVAGRS